MFSILMDTFQRQPTACTFFPKCRYKRMDWLSMVVALCWPCFIVIHMFRKRYHDTIIAYVCIGIRTCESCTV